MIKTIYKELFGFVIKNNFYKNEKYRTSSDPFIVEDFSIIPSENTKNAFNQFGLLLSKKINGFNLMAQVYESAPTVFSVSKKIDRKTKLVFYLQLNNTGLLNFADVAFDKLAESKIYYCNNLGINADLRDSLRLSSQAFVNSVDDLFDIKSSNYSYKHTGLVGNTAGKVIGIDNQDFVIAKTASQNNGVTDLQFDLNSLPEGRYKLEVSGSKKEEFYFAKNQENVMAIVEIFFENTQPNYQILEADYSITTDRPKYQLFFQRRKAFWRYILNMNKTILANPILEISDASNTFIKVAPTTKQAIFTSNTTMDLMEDPMLRGSPAVLERIILKDGIIEKISSLPLPNPSILKLESNQFYSEILVNL